MSDALSRRHCVPCEDGGPPLTREQAQDLMEQIPEWKLSEDAKRITRVFGFKDFAQALAFANKVGQIAEEQWHHPDMMISWGSVEISLSTHSMNGLSENDFIVAAHIDLI